MTSFAVMRFLAGVAIGGEAALLTPYVIETMPLRWRGRLAGLGDTFYTLGLPIATLLGLLLIPLGDDGWRWALVAAGLPAVYVLILRRGTPESPRWLLRRGRVAEARAVVARLGCDWTPGDDEVRQAREEASRTTGMWHGARAIWSRPFARRTTLLWGVWFFLELVYYAFLIWLPTLLVDRGFTLVNSLTYTLVINTAAIGGGIAISLLQETRRATPPGCAPPGRAWPPCSATWAVSSAPWASVSRCPPCTWTGSSSWVPRCSASACSASAA